MRTFLFPERRDMKKIRVRLDSSRLIEFKDGRKNTKQKTIIPLELSNYEGKGGVYLICKDDKVEYVGMTEDFRQRMIAHIFLQKNPEIKFVYFYEEEDVNKRLLYEIICKYYYFKKVKLEWNYAK